VKNRKKENCGNDEAVESAESQKQASLSFHEPLGNLAKTARDSHIPTALAAAEWKSGKPKPGFPLSHRHYFLCIGKNNTKGRALRSTQELESSCRSQGEIVVVNPKK
jgi:hypothetical protein